MFGLRSRALITWHLCHLRIITLSTAAASCGQVWNDQWSTAEEMKPLASYRKN